MLDQCCQALLAGGRPDSPPPTAPPCTRRRWPPSCATTPTNNPQPADADGDAARTGDPSGCCSTARPARRPRSSSPAPAGRVRTRARPTRAQRPGRVDRRRRAAPRAAPPCADAATGDRAAGRPAVVPVLPALAGARLRQRRRSTTPAPSRSTTPRRARSTPPALPWVNGPSETINSGFGNPAAGQQGFGGDSRGYSPAGST